ncbi:hypothetical protein BTN50_1692 (plasmid) [Candidatus Enterovibrio altilux]|uniref:Mobile element protein n=1 Tax=Candidatus Enterovibrio altilux TaxID=1927128 RepID=A0A291BAT7_9GAMM|nr:hypothetical protein BTN50_1692 [Candidatus Enterovibrio luxaltus]
MEVLMMKCVSSIPLRGLQKFINYVFKFIQLPFAMSLLFMH